jgi:protoporphyrinogen oxidase
MKNKSKKNKKVNNIANNNNNSLKKSKKTNKTKKINKNEINQIYDIIIVGGGIAGLYTAYKLLLQSVNKPKILLLESTNRLGGRIKTIHDKETKSNYEAGAGRFHTKQKRIINLIKELDLKEQMIPITNDIKFIPYPSNKYYEVPHFSKIINIQNILDELMVMKNEGKISYEDMINNSLLDLIHKKLNKKYPNIKTQIEEIYEYWSEIAIMNAYDAIKLFNLDFQYSMKYNVLGCGLEKIIELLENKITKMGCDIKLNTPLETITKYNENYNYDINNKFHCNKIVLAIPKHNLLNIKYLTDNIDVKRMLNFVTESPLYRIYVKYPLTELNTYPWFYKLPKISTNLNIKYIIPVDYNNGIIMISYTDGKYAKYWMNKLENGNLEDELNKDLHKLFPEYDIPKPEWIKHYYWNDGAAYWNIGKDGVKLVKKIIKPLKKDNIYICGENYSNHQAWIEGSLQTSDLVVKMIK